MSESKLAKLFRNGRSQAVRLPQEFRFEGEAVRIRRVEGGVLLEPVFSDFDAWVQAIDAGGGIEPWDRAQPETPVRDIF